MRKNQIRALCLCALFAALTAALNQVFIPLAAVPFTLATLAVYCSGAMLGAKYGALSQTVYMLIGASGLPVFSMMRGGLEVILGPRGGYIFGFIAAAWLIGFIVKRSGYKMYILAISAGAGTMFIVAVCWYMFVMKAGVWSALTVCVFPLLPGETAKIVLAALLSRRMRGVVSL